MKSRTDSATLWHLCVRTTFWERGRCCCRLLPSLLFDRPPPFLFLLLSSSSSSSYQGSSFSPTALELSARRRKRKQERNNKSTQDISQGEGMERVNLMHTLIRSCFLAPNFSLPYLINLSLSISPKGISLESRLLGKKEKEEASSTTRR